MCQYLDWKWPSVQAKNEKINSSYIIVKASVCILEGFLMHFVLSVKNPDDLMTEAPLW